LGNGLDGIGNRIGRELQMPPGFRQDRVRQGLGRQLRDFFSRDGSGLDRVILNPARRLGVTRQPLSDEVPVRVKKRLVDEHDGRRKAPLRPQGAFVQKHPPMAFPDQARRPGLGSPGRVQLFLEEEGQLVGIGNGKQLHIAPVFNRSEAVFFEIESRRDVLGVSQLRRGD